MPTLEFYGAGGLEMTTQLTNALERYLKNCCELPECWSVSGSNLDKNDCSPDNPVLSIPFYYATEKIEPDQWKDGDFFSYNKVIFGSDTFQKSLLSACKKAAIIQERINYIPKVIYHKDESYNINVINIQSGNEYSWAEAIRKIQPHTFYVFYWTILPEDKCDQSGELYYEKLKSAKRKYEVHDKIWGYSQFMRRFLKIRNLCFELEIEELAQYLKISPYNDQTTYIEKLFKNKINKL